MLEMMVSGKDKSSGGVYVGNDLLEIINLDFDGNVIWKFSTSDDVNDISTDADGNCYAACADGTAYKVDKDGNEVWSYTFSETLYAIGSDDSGNAYVSVGLNGYLQQMDPGGQTGWSMSFTDVVLSIYAAEDGHVYAGDQDGNLKKIDSNGIEQWVYDGFNNSVDAICGDDQGPSYIYAGGNDDQIRKIDASTGSYGYVYSSSHSDKIVGLAFSKSGHVYSVSIDGTLKKSNASDLLEVWSNSYPYPSPDDVDVSEDGNVFMTRDRGMVKLDESGSQLWKKDYVDPDFAADYVSIR